MIPQQSGSTVSSVLTVVQVILCGRSSPWALGYHGPRAGWAMTQTPEVWVATAAEMAGSQARGKGDQGELAAPSVPREPDLAMPARMLLALPPIPEQKLQVLAANFKVNYKTEA